MYKTTIHTHKGPVHFEFEQYADKTVVALDATLDDFKGIPVKDPVYGDAMKFPEKTVKDCTKIDGCIYLHLGRVPDTIMVEKIGFFLEALKDKNLWKKEMPNLLKGI